MQVIQYSTGEWLDAVAKLLQQRWPTVEPEQLDDVALDLVRDGELRAMTPEQAAKRWLEPVTPEDRAG